jgi:hypothetical protein
MSWSPTLKTTLERLAAIDMGREAMGNHKERSNFIRNITFELQIEKGKKRLINQDANAGKPTRRRNASFSANVVVCLTAQDSMTFRCQTK